MFAIDVPSCTIPPASAQPPPPPPPGVGVTGVGVTGVGVTGVTDGDGDGLGVGDGVGAAAPIELSRRLPSKSVGAKAASPANVSLSPCVLHGDAGFRR